MPSIIRATTASGLQVAPDNSGSLQLQTNGTTTAVTIDTSQNVGIGTTSITAIYGSTLQIGSGTANGSVSLTGSGAGTTGDVFLAGTVDTALLFARASTPLTFGTNDTERMRIDSSGYAQGTVNGLSAGRMQAYQYYRLNSGNAGANATGAQSVFGVGVTLVGSTQYEFEIAFILNKTAGATSHTIAIGFGGTATINNIGYQGSVAGGAAFPYGAQGALGFASNATSTVVTTGAIASAGFHAYYLIKGTVSINAGGTFIPQYSLSAAPGGAYTTAIGSYFKIAPLAASGANVNVGSWA